MPFVSDDELFGQGRPSPAPQGTSAKFVSDAELFADSPAAKPAGRTYTAETEVGQFFQDVGKNATDLAKDAVKSGAAAVDWAVGGLVADPLAFGLKSGIAARGKSDRATNMQVATDAADSLTEPLRNPLQKAVNFFFPDEDLNDSAAGRAMGKLSEMISTGGENVEQLTGGKILKEDVEYLAEAGMLGMQAGGARYAQKKLEARYDPKVGGLPTDITVADDLGTNQPSQSAPRRAEDPNYFADYQGVKAKETDLNRSDARANAEQTAYDLMQRGASKADVERIVRRNPLVGEAMDAILSRRKMAQDSFEDGPLQGEVVDPAGSGEPWNLRPDPIEIEARKPGTAVVEVLKPTRKPGSPRIDIDPKRLAAIGLGGTALGLALTYAESPEEQASALATAGILYVGKGKGLATVKLLELPDSAPLGHILNNSEYTTKVLDRLPRNKNVFKKQEILSQLKRDDITAPEKKVLQDVLDAEPGDTITAKHLAMGVKDLTGGHEFGRRETQEYADYGLDQIDRTKDYSGETFDEGPAADATTTTYTNPKVNLTDGAHFEPDVIGHTRSFVEDGVRHVVEVQSDFFQKAPMLEGKALEDAHNSHGKIYQALETARSLSSEEYRGGPDAKRLRAEFIKLMDGLKSDKYASKSKDFQRYADFENVIGASALRSTIEILRELDYEVVSAIQESPKHLPFKDLAKHWPKRLVREELARAAEMKETPEFLEAKRAAKEYVAAAKEYESSLDDYPGHEDLVKKAAADYYRLAKESLQPFTSGGKPRYLPQQESVRFATADTVAKVEGWPQTDNVQALENERINLKRIDPDGTSTHPVALRLKERIAELEKMQGQKFEKASHQSLYDRHAREVDAFTKKIGGQLITDQHGHTWIEVPVQGQFRGPPQMYGKADVRMLAELGIGAGVGYMLADSDSQYIGAVLGAAAAAAAPVLAKKLGDKYAVVKDATGNLAKGVEETVLGVDKTLGAISTRIGNMSQPLLRRARVYERNVLERSHKYLSATDAFAMELRKVHKVLQGELNRAILTNDPKRIAELLDRARSPRLTQEWNRTRKMLDEIGKELMTYGRLSGMRENYFPRIVKDVEGLMNHFGKDVKGQLEERIGESHKRLIARRGYGLTDIERSDLINSFLQGREAMGAKPGFAKERKIQEVTPELEKYYATPIQSLHSYINSAVKDIEKAKFFGRNLKRISEGEGRTVDIDASVGELLNDMNKKGEVSLKQMEELADILKARFQWGEQAPLGIVTDLKNVAYMGLLGNAVSAASQLGDVATSVYMHGLRPTTAAVVRRLTRKGDVDMRNYGLEDHIAEEFVNTRKTAQALNGIFKAAGFTAVDKFGKNVALEAGRLKYISGLRTAAGKAEFKRKYGKMFEGDTDAVMADLAAGKLTDLAREVHFTELSNMQPITKLEMPQKYLENPNGRFLYMLRTFMLKQADIVRRDAYNEIKAGNTRKGVGNLLRFGVALGVGGATADMVKDWLMGREVDFDAKDIPLNIMKTFMWTQYMTDKGEKEGYLKSFVENSLMPPYKAFNTVVAYLQESKTEKEADKRLRDAVKLIPLGGKLYESHMMGGAEKAAENKAKRDKAQEKAAFTSSAKVDKGSPLSDEDLKEIRRQYRLQGVGQ